MVTCLKGRLQEKGAFVFHGYILGITKLYTVFNNKKKFYLINDTEVCKVYYKKQ